MPWTSGQTKHGGLHPSRLPAGQVWRSFLPNFGLQPATGPAHHADRFMTAYTLADLAALVASRAGTDPATSYTAKLLSEGPAKAAKKLGEEAVEAAIAAVQGDKTGLRNEAADVLYHLVVLLRAGGVELADVMAELERRTAQSGIAEKAARRPA